MKSSWIVGGLSAVAVVVLLAGCRATRAGYATASYRVVRSDGPFEVRDYPALTVVRTAMASRTEGADDGFGRLFRFITGGNDTGEKIAMTTPVFLSGRDADSEMAFVLPETLAAASVPRPTDASVQVREIPRGRFAVLRFRGGRRSGNEAEALEALRTRLEGEGLSSVPTPVYAYFDPPWTPGFLRRNEVMLRLESR